MTNPLTIATAGNVVVPCFLALRARGFEVRRVRRSERGEELWEARAADRAFIGEDPVAVLALVALAETRGRDWKASDEEIDAFLEEYGE